MKIIGEPTKNRIKDKENFVNNVLKRVVIVLQNDPKFAIKEKIDKLNQLDKNLNKKIKNLESLIESAMSLKDNINNEMKTLEESNESKRIRLLKTIIKAR